MLWGSMTEGSGEQALSNLLPPSFAQELCRRA